MSIVITTSDLDTYTGKTLTPAISEMVVAAVNDYIEQRTHRHWGGDPIQITERYDYASIIYLHHQDVQTVDSVKIGYPGNVQTTLPTNAYFVNEVGRLSLFWGQRRSLGARNNDLFEIEYTYGVEDVPSDLKLAALGIAAVMYNYAVNEQQNIVSSSVGSYRIQTIGSIRGASGTGPNPAMNTAEANYAIVDSYTTRRQ